MLTPTQLARRAEREITEGDSAWVDPSLGLARPGHTGADAPSVALVRADRVSAAGDVTCDATAAGVIQRAARVVAVMAHVDDQGQYRITEQLQGTVTAREVVGRIITDLCVVDVTTEGLIVREVAPGVSAREVQARTGAPLWAGPDLTVLEA